jgi:hypothetical protein
MKIGIIGMGHVGSTMHGLLGDHAQLITYDQATDSEYPHSNLAGCDFAVVCVSTPAGPGGECDITEVHEAVKRLPVSRILIKSTVAPGTTDHLVAVTGKQICFCPEYVGQSTYFNPLLADAAEMPFIVLGGAPETRKWFIDALLPVLGPTKSYFQCTAVEAEVVKYMENTFLLRRSASSISSGRSAGLWGRTGTPCVKDGYSTRASSPRTLPSSPPTADSQASACRRTPVPSWPQHVRRATSPPC